MTGRQQASPLTYPLLILLLLGIAIVLALTTGRVNIDVWQGLTDIFQRQESIESLVLMEVRLPRTLLALLVGASLGIAGAAMQGLLHNPLADPGIVGVTNCAALGAVIALYFGLASVAWFVLPVAGLLGALLSVTLITLLTGRYHSMLSVILIGVTINAIVAGLISLAINYAPNPYAIQEIIFWLMGSIANRSLNDVAIVLPFIALGWLLILRQRPFLNAMSFGRDTAQTLGFNPERSRWLLICGVACCVGASVSVSGTIGFIGLIVPHLLRPLVGHEPGRLLALSALGGALVLLLADIAVQHLALNKELKLGVITSLVGGPFFLYLLFKHRNQYP